MTESPPGMTGCLNLVLRHLVFTLSIPVAIAVIVLVMQMVKPALYRSDAAFVPTRTERVPSSFAGIAAQLGVTVPSDNFDQSPAFYADLLRSREVLDPVAVLPLNEGRSLIDLYGIDEGSAAERRQRAVERLRKSLRVAPDPETGVITFSVPARSPATAKAVVEAIIVQVNTFNSTRRRATAQAERQFVEDQLRKANLELGDAELKLKEFDTRNVQIDRSPELRLQRDRLFRRLIDRQELVTMLNQSFVRASIDEVKNTPSITIVERASLPIRREPKGSLSLAAAAFVITAFLGLMTALALEYFARLQTANGAEHLEFRRQVARFTSKRHSR